MEQEIFRAGVRPGSPTTGDEIKILICYILSNIGGTMSFEQLHDTLSEQELVNYFELIAAVESLSATGHVTVIEQENAAALYEITRLGRSTAETVDGLLPKSVRDKAVNAALKLLQREKRKQEVKTEILPLDRGYAVRISLPGDGSLIDFKVFCPTKEEAGLVRRRFLNDPAYIYKGILALLTGDRGVIGEMFPSKEELF